jgi:hypothetical protein
MTATMGAKFGAKLSSDCHRSLDDSAARSADLSRDLPELPNKSLTARRNMLTIFIASANLSSVLIIPRG